MVSCIYERLHNSCSCHLGQDQYAPTRWWWRHYVQKSEVHTDKRAQWSACYRQITDRCTTVAEFWWSEVDHQHMLCFIWECLCDTSQSVCGTKLFTWAKSEWWPQIHASRAQLWQRPIDVSEHEEEKEGRKEGEREDIPWRTNLIAILLMRDKFLHGSQLDSWFICLRQCLPCHACQTVTQQWWSKTTSTAGTKITRCSPQISPRSNMKAWVCHPNCNTLLSQI